MSNTFEIIDAIIAHRGCSLRELAHKAELPYTTLASIMSRRSNRISKSILEAVAKALEVDFYDLVPREADMQTTGTGTNIIKYPTECSDEFMKATLRRIIGEDYILYIPENNQQRARNATTYRYERMQTCPITARRQFKQSIDFVLGKLNDEGLMEAMRRVLDVASNPQYCISTDSHTSSNKKEDELCQEKEQ